MRNICFAHDPGGREVVRTTLHGHSLLGCPLLNKGSAFGEAERAEFELAGLLPPHVETLDEQVVRAYAAYHHEDDELERHVYLRGLQDQNEVLFYRLLHEYVSEMTPIVYTPVVADGCRFFSRIFRRPRGLFIAWPNRDRIEEMLENRAYQATGVIVVTDGERILGIGDQGAGGMGIPIGKLSLYTLLGGIHPARTLPILLDCGTNNPELLRDPLYLGWRHERIRGNEYNDFIERFVAAVKRKLPHVLLQWEDFAFPNARPILDRYRDSLCTFNDDIQGTAAVTLGALRAAISVAGTRVADQRVVVLGAGSAGTGISEFLCRALVENGLSDVEAHRRFWLVDRNGLLNTKQTGLTDAQQRFAQPADGIADWRRGAGGEIDLLEVVRRVSPTILIGVSGQPGMFTREVVTEMGRKAARPIIFPLSNPTSKSEAAPADLLAWTDGRAIVATGSPYAPVEIGGRSIPIAQCNNSYIFPAIGLAVIASGARRVTDGMLFAAARALAGCSPTVRDAAGALLPPLEDAHQVSSEIAVAVGLEAQREGHAAAFSEAELRGRIAATIWKPQYPNLARTRD